MWSRREGVGISAFLFLSLNLSDCMLPTRKPTVKPTFPPTPVPDVQECITDSELNLNFDLKFMEDAVDLFGRLTKRLAPLLSEARLNMPDLIYQLPDTCRYEHPVEVIKSHGYTVYQDKITSEDGFILTAWRVRSKTKYDSTKNPVLLQHGLFCSGADWLYMGKDYALPYILANRGYEVWIGNARGTQYSMEHTFHDPKNSSSDYWKHSVHEMGKFDVIATIERMKTVTRKNKVNYVGYSMGTTMFFIYASENKDHYAQNVHRFVGLAPAMYIHHLASQFKLLAPLFNTEVFHGLLLTVGKIAEREVDGPIKYNSAVTQFVKLSNILLPYLVPLVKSVLDTSVLSLLIPGEYAIKNTQAFQRAMGKFPENISIRTVRHYVQFFAKKVFGRFEHPSPIENQRSYGSVVPPRYDVGNVKVPSLFIGGQTDSLVVPADSKYTADQIRKCDVPGTCANVKYNLVPCFTHLDFIWGPRNETYQYAYDQILRWFDDTWDDAIEPDVRGNATYDADYCKEKYRRKGPISVPDPFF